jgi:antitoxin component YwqK of YwqJK toxin-antitoxin module
VYSQKIQYYGTDLKKIRSISFTLNNKKDSVWTTYAEDGSIIKQEKYKADTLIEIIK